MADPTYDQTFVCTAIPAGIDGDELVLAVIVSPRLSSSDGQPADLSNWPDAEQWPTIQPAWEVKIEQGANTATVNIEPAAVAAAADDSYANAFSQMFPPGQTTTPYVPKDRQTAHIVSYPVAKVRDAVKDLHVSVLQTARTSFPLVEDLEEHDTFKALLKSLEGEEVSEDTILTDEETSLGRAFTDLEGGHGVRPHSEGPPPTVSDIDPNGGLNDGGTVVTIIGTNFREGAVVKFGSAIAPQASTVVHSPTLITCVSPPRPPVATGTVEAADTPGTGTSDGTSTLTVNVTVTTSAGTSPATSGARFVYAPPIPPGPPVIHFSNPDSVAGGGPLNNIELTGKNLLDPISVTYKHEDPTIPEFTGTFPANPFPTELGNSAHGDVSSHCTIATGHRFHRRHGDGDNRGRPGQLRDQLLRTSGAEVTELKQIPQFDLQTALAAMADYPEVLRRFGVIRTVRVKLADLAEQGVTVDGGGADGEVKISAKPSWAPKTTGPPPTVVAVTVPAVLLPGRFALEKDGRVDPAELGVLEIDTDSAGIRHVDVARQVFNADTANAAALAAVPQKLPPVNRPVELSLPSLRNAGLSIFERNRATKLHDKLVDNSALLSATADEELAKAAHAVIGHVVDVWDDRTKKWHTLCARNGTYTLPGGASFTHADEGAVSLNVTHVDGPPESTPLYLHQSMLRWTGWSLVAPPPGKNVEETSQDEGGPEPKPPTESALPGFNVKFTARPGTLPTLRFGRRYRFQLRTMNAAGIADPLEPNSQNFDRAIPPTGEPAFPFLRFEPVISPVVVAAHPMSEGESLETLVLRPQPKINGIISLLLTPVFGNPPIRHIAPPKVGQLLCELHEMVDTRTGAPNPNSYRMLAERDRANLASLGKPDPRQPNQRYYDKPTLPVEWLPDPISRGAAITGLPGGPVIISFDPSLRGAWPDLRSFRIQIADATSGPKSQWSGLGRLLTIYVPRGETLRVRLSSTLAEKDLATLGHLQWLMETPGVPASTIAAVRADLVNGQAWQVTPFRTLTLVNAVRTPVRKPDLLSIGPLDAPAPAFPRPVGATRQPLKGVVSVHRPSTGQLALVAKWTDPVDDPAADGPVNVVFNATPTLAPILPPTVPPATKPPAETPVLDVGYDPSPTTGEQVPFTGTHVFRDTHRHLVEYSMVGTTRYLEHFVQRGPVQLMAETPVRLSNVGFVPGTEQVRSVDAEPVSYRRGVDYKLDDTLGTIARIDGGAITSGQTVEVAIVAPPVTSTSNIRSYDVLSTARPKAPEVAWIVPTFGWTETTANKGAQKTRTRSGGGLRIFLERPWYSSGYGEQLAVVLLEGTDPGSDNQLASLVTHVARDPAVSSEPIPEYPTPEQFTLAKIRRRTLSLPEFEDRPSVSDRPTVAVAAHDVVWDPDRQRWACDVVLPPDRTYGPFIRLALARYQHGSIAGVELSAVTDVEWAQLTPDRSATVVFDTKNKTKLALSVRGRSHGGMAKAPGPNVISAIVQTAPTSDTSDLAWTTLGAAGGTPLIATPQPDGTTLWSLPITLPKSRTSAPFRLVITEHERHGDQGEGRRLVYTDVIRL